MNHTHKTYCESKSSVHHNALGRKDLDREYYRSDDSEAWGLQHKKSTLYWAIYTAIITILMIALQICC